jgi:sialate O-acetylesterase
VVQDITNIHSSNKKICGERMAVMALNRLYGHDVVASGPRFKDATLKGKVVRVRFSGIDKGLSTKDGKEPIWFELSEDGTTFVKAEAIVLSGDTVELTSSLPAPTHVRMGWSDIAMPNLQDKNGWPVFSFPAQEIKRLDIGVEPQQPAALH